jgi:putative nucleotidyltransferase with HDIG domain
MSARTAGVAAVPAFEMPEVAASSAALVAEALEATLRLRAPGMHASTPMVRQLALKVGHELDLDAHSADLLDVSARVRDVGMIALPDDVVLATTALSPAGWELMNSHPVLGAGLLDGFPVTAAAARVVRSHHERWDGEGYPDGLGGNAIPILSRVIATCDAFVAIASDRPHRRGLGAEIALEQVVRGAGSQFDAQVVDALVTALGRQSARAAVARVARAPVAAGADPDAQLSSRGDLARAIIEFEVMPAFAPAQERILAALALDQTSAGEMVAALENDTGATIAVLRRAQEAGGRKTITNVADAVNALSRADIQQVVAALPCAEFPWRTSAFEVLLQQSRVHAQAVARAAVRISRELGLDEHDDILVVALLHDVGKLVVGRAAHEAGDPTVETATPEERLRHEQRSLGMDHASVGGLLLGKWGLPGRVADAVATHHTAEADQESATYVRLADMVVHHTQGDAIDRTKMLELAQKLGLSSAALRDVLFDLPHTSGSQQRRAEPSPLSHRETGVLRVLATGKAYGEIALDLGVAASTVRTHLHHAYAKLSVSDGAQAVLRATEMGWI